MKMVLKSLMCWQRTDLVEECSLLLFRVLVSLAMINTHGLKKIMDFQATVQHIPDPFGVGGQTSALIAIVANIIAPLFIIFGLFTRLAILPVLAVTLVGFFVVHGNDPWPVRDTPLMYSLAYLLILFMGPGRFSFDARLKK